MPRPPVYNSRVVKIDAATDGTEQRLPLEGKLAQRQLRLMRSKLSIFTMGWYDAVTFDLIRHAKRRDTFPSRGRPFLCPGRRSADFCRSDIVTRRTGHAPPLQGRTGLFLKKSAPADGFRLALVFFAAPGGYFSSGRGSGDTTGLPSRSRRTVRPPA